MLGFGYAFHVLLDDDDDDDEMANPERRLYKIKTSWVCLGPKACRFVGQYVILHQQ